MRIVTLLLIGLLGGGAAAWAQGQAPAQSPAPAPLLSPRAAGAGARWSFRRVDDGFVRLDNKTGQVAHCTPVRANWACQAVAQDPPP